MRCCRISHAETSVRLAIAHALAVARGAGVRVVWTLFVAWLMIVWQYMYFTHPFTIRLTRYFLVWRLILRLSLGARGSAGCVASASRALFASVRRLCAGLISIYTIRPCWCRVAILRAFINSAISPSLEIGMSKPVLVVSKLHCVGFAVRSRFICPLWFMLTSEAMNKRTQDQSLVTRAQFGSEFS